MTAPQAAASTRTREAIRERVRVDGRVRLSDRLIRDVLLGWPARADTVGLVKDAASACGVDVASIPERTADDVAAWTAKRRGVGKSERNRVAELEAEVERLAADIGIARRERAESMNALANARAYIAEQMREWKRQWSEVCAERDDAKAHRAELESEVARLRAELAARKHAPAKRLRVIMPDGVTFRASETNETNAQTSENTTLPHGA